MSRARWAFVLLAVCAATLPEAAQAAKLIGLTYSERRRPCLPASMACRLVAGPHACDAAGNTPEGGKAAEREPLCRAWPANLAGATPPPPPPPHAPPCLACLSSLHHRRGDLRGHLQRLCRHPDDHEDREKRSQGRDNAAVQRVRRSCPCTPYGPALLGAVYMATPCMQQHACWCIVPLWGCIPQTAVVLYNRTPPATARAHPAGRSLTATPR